MAGQRHGFQHFVLHFGKKSGGNLVLRSGSGDALTILPGGVTIIGGSSTTKQGGNVRLIPGAGLIGGNLTLKGGSGIMPRKGSVMGLSGDGITSSELAKFISKRSVMGNSHFLSVEVHPVVIYGSYQVKDFMIVAEYWLKLGY